MTGFAVGRLATSGRGRHSPWLVPACVALAIAPDLDFVPGLLLAGRPSLYHQGASHSVAVALALSLALAWGLARGGRDLPRVWLALFAAFASHLALDWLGTDSRVPIGMPLLWPFSDATWISPVAILPGIRHSQPGRESSAEWLADVLSLENVRALFVEALLVGPLVLGVEWIRRRRRER